MITDRMQVGQNVAQNGGSCSSSNLSASWVSSVNNWFSEVANMQSGYATTSDW